MAAATLITLTESPAPVFVKMGTETTNLINELTAASAVQCGKKRAREDCDDGEQDGRAAQRPRIAPGVFFRLFLIL